MSKSIYRLPEPETAVFERLLLLLHQSKLGEQANLASLVSQILSVADGNKDRRVSLPEARSTWALLQMDEVQIRTVLTSFLWQKC